MIESLKARTVKLEWIGEAPCATKDTALLIPQYQECANNPHGFVERLAYFKKLAAEFRDEVDVILIDDGSADDSLPVIREFLCQNPRAFYVASVFPNANKVGALFQATLSISHEFVILSDFDTDIVGLKKLLQNRDFLRKDPSLMGCYFRMLPFQASGNTFHFQQLEYSLARSLYKFHRKERSIRVMPGAGSCYKREVLITIYSQHSGLRSGEDREATLIGLRLGYKAIYMNDVLALTRTPLSLEALIKQRVRWNLGYLETFCKEWKFYLRQIKDLTRIGIVTLVDLLTILFVLAMPIIMIMISIRNVLFLLIFLLLSYIFSVGWYFNLLMMSSHESVEFKKNRATLVFRYPLLKLYVDYLAWMGAIIHFGKKLSRN